MYIMLKANMCYTQSQQSNSRVNRAARPKQKRGKRWNQGGRERERERERAKHRAPERKIINGKEEEWREMKGMDKCFQCWRKRKDCGIAWHSSSYAT